MTDRERDDLRDDAALERAVRELPSVEADEGFRARLREAFVSGGIEGLAEVPEEPAPPARGALLRIILPVGAAAAVLVAALGLLVVGERGPGLRVFEVSGTGNVIVDGEAIPVADRGRLEASLGPGASVTVPPTATLTLVVPGTALFELAGGTRMILPTAFRRGFGRDVRGHLSAGEVRFAGGPGFAGRRMTLTTPEGIVVVSGTLLSVQSDDRGTCVCVLGGTVSVGVDDADMERVVPGQRKVMLRTGEVKIVPVAPPHEQGVRRMMERAAGRFTRK